MQVYTPLDLLVFFITSGRVYFVNDDYIPFKIMIKGSYFGEIEIVSEVKTVRSFTAIASEKTDTLTLSKQVKFFFIFFFFIFYFLIFYFFFIYFLDL